MKRCKLIAMVLALACAGIPLTTAVSCDPYGGGFDFYRNDDGDYYYDDGYYYDGYYDYGYGYDYYYDCGWWCY